MYTDVQVVGAQSFLAPGSTATPDYESDIQSETTSTSFDVIISVMVTFESGFTELTELGLNWSGIDRDVLELTVDFVISQDSGGKIH